MDAPFSNSHSPAHPGALRRLAAERKSRWLSDVCAVFAAACGLIGLLVVLLGYRDAMTLPDVAAGTDQKFTQSASALFGGIIVGAVFELVSLLSLGVALMHSQRRRKTMLAGIRVLAFAIVFAGLHVLLRK